MVYVDAFHESVDILTEGLERVHPFQRTSRCRTICPTVVSSPT